MRISKETSAKSLKYFGDIIGCKTKGEVRDVRNKINGRERELADEETANRHVLQEFVDSVAESMCAFDFEDREFESVEDEYLF